jgi:hypothetical protein
MGPAIVLLSLALVFAGVGLFIAGLKWTLIVAVALVGISALTGWSRRSDRTLRR